MPIKLTPSPVTASASLAADDVAALIAAVAPVISLPEGDSLDKAIAVNVTIQPNGSGVLNVRFAK